VPVLAGAARRADPDPAANVRRLVGAGHRVLIIDGSADINCSHGIWLRNLEWLRPDNGTGVGLARLGCGSRYLNRPLWQPRQRISQDLFGSAMTIRAGIVQECVLPLLRASGKRWS